MNDEMNPLKSSFLPISNHDAEILILGSLPGEKSLELQEYYGHAQNKFWKLIAAITEHELPQDYEEKVKLLKISKIALWDVVHSAHRIGSLDTAILNEIQNDLEIFINDHQNLKIIAFNGRKAESLFNKYFQKKDEINYVLLPSSSSANARMLMDRMVEQWKEKLFGEG